MQDKYIQSLRYKLQKRVRRLNSADSDLILFNLRQFFAFFESSPILCGIRDELLASVSSEVLDGLMTTLFAENDQVPVGRTEAEEAAFGYWFLKHWAESTEEFRWWDVGCRYGADGNMNEMLDRVRVVFLEPFYEYVDEHIDNQQATLCFLRKYKQRCEWFRRKQLYQLAADETGKAESSLAFDLYEYLHDQGIDFSIEPRSASGRPDLITEQVGDDKVVADAKVFWPERSKGKPYIISGFNQVYTYLRDYNEPFGYLVIFKMCEDDLKFMVPSTTAMFPSLSHNNKTIFFVVVDICEYEATASKRGQLKVHEVTAEDLIHAVESVDRQQSTSAEAGTANIAKNQTTAHPNQ